METDAAAVSTKDKKSWIIGEVETTVGRIPRVATKLNWQDRLGMVKVRVGLQRMRYTIEPGLYAVGKPTADSPVFVSANYKVSFDYLRRELGEINGWIMVIDTKGINVWCAAGKGTFGTEEIIHRIESTHLSEVVNHRQIIVPQLGAPGVAAHEVKRHSSFRVIYRPVRAHDIPEFLNAGMKTSAEMREINFNLSDRTVLIPVELAMGPFALGVALVLFFLAGVSRNGYILPGWTGGREVLIVIGAFISGSALTPIFLPWLPGRALSVKGMISGLIFAIVLVFAGLIPSAHRWPTGNGSLDFTDAGNRGFYGDEFTGSTTYTSLSGVKKEIRYAVPAQIIVAMLGLSLWVTARFF